MLSIEDLILEELKSIKANQSAMSDKMDIHISVTDTRLVKVETLVHPLFSNGQPGLLATFDRRVRSLEFWRVYVLGAAASVGTMLGIVATWLKFKHS